MMKLISNKFWGASPKVMTNFYKTAIRSIFDYSCQVMDSFNKSNMSKLDAIQRKAIKIALGLRDSTPNRVVTAESGLPTIYHRFILLTRNYYIKNASIVSNLVTQSAFKLYNEINRKFTNNILKLDNNRSNLFSYNAIYFLKNNIDKSNIKKFPYHHYYNNSTEVKTYKINLISTNTKDLENSTNIENTFNNLYTHLTRDRCVFYTDGSKSETRTSFASHSFDMNGNYQARIPNNASIFTAESLAISKTLDIILEKETTLDKFTIFTDSQFCLLALAATSKNKGNSFLIGEIKSKLINI